MGSHVKIGVTYPTMRANVITIDVIDTVFPQIVSSLEYIPPLNSFLTSVRKLFKFLLHKGKINEETI